MTVVSGPGSGRPQVSAVVYPRPEGHFKLWSQWGQGVVLPDGRFLSAAGTHDGVDGNSYVFVFDPATGSLTRIADVLTNVPHQPGAWGYGKIHAQLVPVGCDAVLFATYWGDRDGLIYANGYTGDHLLSLDPWTYAVTDLGVPVPEHGIPSLAGDGALVYGEAVDPRGRTDGTKNDVGTFFVFDPATRKVVYRSDDLGHTGFRNIAVMRDGTANVAGPGSSLLRYSVGGELAESGASAPAGWMRASTRSTSDGSVYAVSRAPERFFAIHRDGTVTDLGPAPGYVASMALTADEREIVFVPDAHGLAWEKKTPLMAFDPVTRSSRTIVELEPLVKDKLGLVAGGSYGVAVDQATGRIFVGLNAGPTTDNPWGEVVLAVVEP
ncbi:hypothetical protein BN11_560009 [Nostocoides australiense Ben110]|uniref:Uncharacterized protein n=1 Tax=Nostocoides australiense Ben110 TaxID=1193182 RepID=W6JZZ7_9MICO|nr:hypothetical protein BN11_560009 [Tetrasphaera australiensis Ben110]